MAKAIKTYTGGIHGLVQAAVREDGALFQRQFLTHAGRDAQHGVFGHDEVLHLRFELAHQEASAGRSFTGSGIGHRREEGRAQGSGILQAAQQQVLVSILLQPFCICNNIYKALFSNRS